jgi:hypothetical protein
MRTDPIQSGTLSERCIGWTALVLACVCLPLASSWAPRPIHGSSDPALTGVHVFGWGFSGPDAIAVSGNNAWIANGAGRAGSLDGCERDHRGFASKRVRACLRFLTSQTPSPLEAT